MTQLASRVRAARFFRTLQAAAVASLVLAATCAVPSSAAAQALDLSSEEFARVAMTVLGFDYFAARCTSTQPASDVEAIDRWVEANAVERVRERIAALERDPSEGARVGQLRRAVDANMAKLTGPPCGLALAVIRTREAQFATAAPAVLAALKRAPAAPSSPATPARAAASPAASRTAAPRIEASALVAQIDSVGFGSRATMGIGGFMAMAVYPIVLFKNGEALTDIEQLGTMTGLAASQRGDPSDWTRWRRAGSKVELESKGE